MRREAGTEAEPLSGARRVLVVRPDNIGDVVLTSPLLRNLKAHRRDLEIGLLASPAGATAAPLLPWVDEVIETRPVWQDLRGDLPLDPRRELALVERLRDGRWGVALIATSFRQTAWPPAYAAYLAGIPVRVGFAPDFGGSLLTHPVRPPDTTTHQAERNLRLLAALGVPVEDDRLEIVVPMEARLAVQARLARVGIDAADPILVVPGASAPARRPDPGQLGRAARAISDRSGRPVVVAGTPRERDLVAACLAAAPGAIDAGDDLGITGLAALVEAAALVLCANSAALHLADALARPVVAAYSGTDLATQWRPRQAPAALLAVPTDCSPCYGITCPLVDGPAAPPCLDLDPDRISGEGIALLAAAGETAERAAPGRREATWVA